MIELFREYWWAAVAVAALVVVITHVGLVKLVAVLQESDRSAAAKRGDASLAVNSDALGEKCQG
jgi:hypothetical protein